MVERLNKWLFNHRQHVIIVATVVGLIAGMLGYLIGKVHPYEMVGPLFGALLSLWVGIMIERVAKI